MAIDLLPFWPWLRRPWRRVILLGVSLDLGMMAVTAAPSITAFAPVSGAPGTSVQISGNDLGATTEVKFGAAPAVFSVLSASLIAATVPLEATSERITVTTGTGVAVSATSFKVSPVIFEFLPERAPIGATITIDGANFEGTTTVRFNGANAPQFSITSPTQIRVDVPPGATSGPVTITTPVDSVRSDTSFVVTGKEPFVASFSPRSGAPGTVVSLQGANFSAPLTVRFNGTNAPQPSIPSPSQIRVAVPASAASGLITVSNSFGMGTSVDPFVVTTAPVIEEFAPIGGPAGTSVTINGRNFLGTTAVRFGGKPATAVSVVAATQLHATVPAGATNGPITITTPQGTGSSVLPFIASAAPLIGEFSPLSGPPQTQISINGLNFTGTRAVKLNGTIISFGVTAPTQISATIPFGASSGLITVSNAAGSDTSLEPFLVRTGKPIITSFDPPAGAARTTVTVEGFDFTGASAVKFNGVPAVFHVGGDTPAQITTLVPDTATTGPVSVTTPSGTVISSNAFIVAPGISSFAPGSGIAGTTVTIRGTNLSNLLAVRFKDVAADFETTSTNEIQARVPLEAATGAINLINAAGIVGAPGSFVVQPNVTSFTPTSGSAGTAVTISGSGFGDLTGVRFGGSDAVSVSSLSRTQIVAVVPVGAATGPIAVLTRSSSTQTALPFIVGAAADLVLLHTQLTNVVFQNQVQTYTLTVTNRGPGTSTGFVVTNMLPANVLVLAITNNQGVIRRSGQEITLTAGILAVGSTIQFKITLLPFTAGSMTNVAQVTGREPDPDPSNNGSAQVADVLVNTATLRVQQLAANSLRISWPVAAPDFVLEFSEALSTPTRWQPVNVPPVTVGDQRVVTLAITPPNRLFRLRRP